MPFKVREQRGLPPLAEHDVREVFEAAPNHGIPRCALGDEHVYVGVPFQVAPESVDAADDARGEALLVVLFVKPACDNLRSGLKEGIEKLALLAENEA